MIINKVLGWLPIVSSSWFVFFLFLANGHPKNLMSLAALGWLLPLAALLVFSLELRGRLSLVSLWLPTVSLLLSFTSIFIFLDRLLSRQVLLGGAAVILYLDFFYLYLFVSRGAPAQAPHQSKHDTGQAQVYNHRVLARANFNFIFLSVFLGVSAIFAWSVFLANTLWPLLIIIFLLITGLTGLMLYEHLTAFGKIVSPALWLLAVVIGLLAAQFFWVLNLWPVGFLIKGAVFSLLVYFLIYLARAWLAETFNRRTVWKVFILCLATIVIILLMARWV